MFVSHKLVLVQCGSAGHVLEDIEVAELSQMLDYSQPHAPCNPNITSLVTSSMIVVL